MIDNNKNKAYKCHSCGGYLSKEISINARDTNSGINVNLCSMSCSKIYTNQTQNIILLDCPVCRGNVINDDISFSQCCKYINNNLTVSRNDPREHSRYSDVPSDSVKRLFTVKRLFIFYSNNQIIFK